MLELIGVVAILVILGSLLLPRILGSSRVGAVAAGGINQARVQEAVSATHAVKAAAAQHYARFGSLASGDGSALPVSSYEKYDSVLITEQLLDRPFAPRLGTGATVQLVSASGLSGATAVGSGRAYDLQGTGRNSIVGASYVLEAIISGISEQEAKALNDALDGQQLGADPGIADRLGSVTYPPFTPSSKGRVYIHIFHH